MSFRATFGSKRLRSDSKGISTIVGTIFMVIIILYMGLNVFSYTLYKNAQFRDTANLLDRIDVERIREEVAVSDANFTAGDDEVLLRAQLQNDGTVPVELMTLWIVQATTEKYGYFGSLDIALEPGASYDFEKSVGMVGIGPQYPFTAWFVTSRGNRIQFVEETDMVDFVNYSEHTVISETAGGIGYLTMDFGSFKYYEYQSPIELEDFPNGSESMDVPRATYLAFAINMTNKNPDEQDVTIDSHSLWWGIYEKSAVPHNMWWYIVNADSNGTISPTFTPILIPFNETARLVFASETDVWFSGFTWKQSTKVECTAPIILMLHGTVGSKPFSQTLPFVALRFTDEPGSQLMHVESIDFDEGGNKLYITVTIFDDESGPVDGATVYMNITDPTGTNQTVSEVTGGDGEATYIVDKPDKGTYTVTVTNVTHDTLIYDPDDNVETSDSYEVT